MNTHNIGTMIIFNMEKSPDIAKNYILNMNKLFVE